MTIRGMGMKMSNDQIKLLADTAKGIGIAWIVGGIIAPILRAETPFPYVVMVATGIGIGALCILIALGILNLLKEDE